jgi:hypothetical protein
VGLTSGSKAGTRSDYLNGSQSAGRRAHTGALRNGSLLHGGFQAKSPIATFKIPSKPRCSRYNFALHSALGRQTVPNSSARPFASVRCEAAIRLVSG